MNRLPYKTLAFALALSVLLLASATHAQEAMRIEPNGNVGIGAATATEKLHVQDPDNAQIFVQNTSPIAAERIPFRIENRGKARFVISNTDSGVIWTFDNAGQAFNISKAGTGVAELVVDGNGDLIVAYGNVFSQGFNNVSSREVKQSIEPVSEADILQRLAELPVSTWQYRSDDSNRTHIGPMAEDFAEIFGLGDGTHISLSDASGIALAAIQALQKEVMEKQARIETLESRLETEVAELRERLDAFEAQQRN